QLALVLQGALEASDGAQNARLGSSMAAIGDMNGDGFQELVVGAPLEDDHQGAVYVFYGRGRTIQRRHRQRLPAAGFSAGLRYFGQSVHGVLDVNGDRLVDLAVGALGAAAIIWSRGVVRVQAGLLFQPEKVDVSNKDCRRGGKAAACMAVTVCLSLSSRTSATATVGADVWYSLAFDEGRSPPRAVLEEPDQQQLSRLFLQTGSQSCRHHAFSVQETSDYGHPITVVLETGLQDPDRGPVLDPDQPSVLRAAVS
ncbi:unnamed protein product, partial [Tetraodon nigroviridis]